ncbi:unnamed protein product, partial [Polarella glacialis]
GGAPAAPQVRRPVLLKPKAVPEGEAAAADSILSRFQKSWKARLQSPPPARNAVQPQPPIQPQPLPAEQVAVPSASERGEGDSLEGTRAGGGLGGTWRHWSTSQLDRPLGSAEKDEVGRAEIPAPSDLVLGDKTNNVTHAVVLESSEDEPEEKELTEGTGKKGNLPWQGSPQADERHVNRFSQASNEAMDLFASGSHVPRSPLSHSPDRQKELSERAAPSRSCSTDGRKGNRHRKKAAPSSSFSTDGRKSRRHRKKRRSRSGRRKTNRKKKKRKCLAKPVKLGRDDPGVDASPSLSVSRHSRHSVSSPIELEESPDEMTADLELQPLRQLRSATAQISDDSKNAKAARIRDSEHLEDAEVRQKGAEVRKSIVLKKRKSASSCREVAAEHLSQEATQESATPIPVQTQADAKKEELLKRLAALRAFGKAGLSSAAGGSGTGALTAPKALGGATVEGSAAAPPRRRGREADSDSYSAGGDSASDSNNEEQGVTEPAEELLRKSREAALRAFMVLRKKSAADVSPALPSHSDAIAAARQKALMAFGLKKQAEKT